MASTALVGAAPASAVTTREAAMLAKINNARAAHGLRPLRLSGELTTLARTHSRQMASSTTLFHTASFSSICCWSAIAENVGMGDSVSTVHRALMRSSSHRSNILNGRMRQVGVGIVAVNGRIWVTEIFRRPA
ncbi:MAG TPA: CAP domain-containing protein [Actinoplanes sp.]|nr:CAP domain-containing protein [Actinoplanes sp.]